MEDKVVVVNAVSSAVSVRNDGLRFVREWAKKGSKISIPKETLEELMYDPGFQYMIEKGVLYIEDMEVKKELAIEPEDAAKPVNIIVLNDAQRKRLLTVAPVAELGRTLEKLSVEQKDELVKYAVDNKIMDLERNKILKDATDVDVMQCIMNKEKSEEKE